MDRTTIVVLYFLSSPACCGLRCCSSPAVRASFRVVTLLTSVYSASFTLHGQLRDAERHRSTDGDKQYVLDLIIQTINVIV